MGNGKNIDFWDDDWLEIGNFRSHVEGPLHLYEQEYKVCDVIRRGVWNLDALSLTLPDHIVSRILNLDPLTHKAQSDLRAPIYLQPEGFSLALAYQAQFTNNIRDALAGIWKVNTSPKVQFFLWLVCQDRLPHNKMLRDRHISHEAQCPRCSHDVEDTNHILR